MNDASNYLFRLQRVGTRHSKNRRAHSKTSVLLKIFVGGMEAETVERNRVVKEQREAVVSMDKRDPMQQAIDFVKRGASQHPSLLSVLGATPGEFVASMFKFLAHKAQEDIDVSQKTDPTRWWLVMGDAYLLLHSLARYACLHCQRLPLCPSVCEAPFASASILK